MIPRSVLAIIGSWLIAHCIKYAIAASTQAARPNLRRQLFISGGMPSSHAAISWAVWVVVVMSDGIHSSAAAIATLVALIFCYDAVKVRRSSGEQGEAIAQIIDKSGLSVAKPRAARGHTPLEVCAGATLGLIIGYVVFYIT